LIKSRISEYISTYFGSVICEKANEIQNDLLNILSIKENPTKIRAIIFEKGNPIHIVIDEKNKVIFHDCLSFFNPEENYPCAHLTKLLLAINPNTAMQIFQDWHLYTFINQSDKDVSKNFYLLSELFFHSNLFIDSLHFLNKAIFYAEVNVDLIKLYIGRIINKNLFRRLFVFLDDLFENYPDNNFLELCGENLRKGIIKLFKSIPSLSLSDLLKIIKSLYNIGNNIDLIIDTEEFINEIQKLFNSKNFNSQFFAHICLQLLYNKNKIDEVHFERITNTNNDLIVFKKKLAKKLDVFLEDIHTLSEYEQIKFILKLFHIPQEKFQEKYNHFITERQQIEETFHIRKLAFLKLLIKRSKIFLNSKVDIEKERDKYRIIHDPDIIKNQFYTDYLLPRLGFFGNNFEMIKPRDIAINFYLFYRLYRINWNELPDVYYFRNKFLDELATQNIKSKQGLPLMRYGVDYTLDAGLEFLDNNEILIIEWDLANKSYYGGVVMAFGTAKMIPDYENPLLYDIKPFDLTFCFKNPREIDSENLKIMKIISKCSFKDAIYKVSRGMSFIEGSYPVSLILDVLNHEISPLDAINLLDESPKKNYVPHFYQFIHEFKEFIFNEVLKAKLENIGELKKISDTNVETIIKLIGLTNSLAGIQFPYSETIKLLLEPGITRDSLRFKLINTVHEYIQAILNSDKIGNTIIFDLNKMKNTPFSQYSEQILKIRKEEFESAIIYQTKERGSYYYDLSNIALTYYGIQISKILKILGKLSIKQPIFDRFAEIAQKIGLSLNIVINNN